MKYLLFTKNNLQQLYKLITQNKRFAIIAGLIFLVIIGLGYRFFMIYMTAKYSKMMPAKIVEIEKISLGNIQQTSKFIGKITSKNSTRLVSKKTGIVAELVKSGSIINKGDLIARIEDLDIEKNYKLAKESEQIASAQFQRAKELYKTGLSSKNELEAKKNLWIASQSNLSNIKLALDQNIIEAPFDGIVGTFKIYQGSQLQAGEKIVDFYNNKNFIVEFDLPPDAMKMIGENARVIIFNKEYKITTIQQMVDEKTRMCPASVEVGCLKCIIGSIVDVNLVTEEKFNVKIAPYNATFIRNGQNFVYIVKDNKAEMTQVTLGIRQKDKVEILSGLEQGDLIISNGINRIHPGSDVNIAGDGTQQEKK